jgi:ABC-type amino acid transport system permease subunit
VLDGFWLDVKLFVIVEVAVLAVGLALAVLRTSRAPAFFPFRLLTVVYVDLFRGIPTILLVYLVGFGVPACRWSAPAPRRARRSAPRPRRSRTASRRARSRRGRRGRIP